MCLSILTGVTPHWIFVSLSLLNNTGSQSRMHGRQQELRPGSRNYSLQYYQNSVAIERMIEGQDSPARFRKFEVPKASIPDVLKYSMTFLDLIFVFP
jgi:hypothetical protein